MTVDGHTQHWVVYVTASRVEGRVASLSVIESAADGSTTEHTIDGFDENRTGYTLTLDYSRVSDRFTLGYKSASSDDGVTQGAAIAPTLARTPPASSRSVSTAGPTRSRSVSPSRNRSSRTPRPACPAST